MGADDVAVVLALALATYETIAWFTRKVPTVTKVINSRPWVVRAGIVGGALLWAGDHFRVW